MSDGLPIEQLQHLAENPLANVQGPSRARTLGMIGAAALAIPALGTAGYKLWKKHHAQPLPEMQHAPELRSLDANGVPSDAEWEQLKGHLNEEDTQSLFAAMAAHDAKHSTKTGAVTAEEVAGRAKWTPEKQEEEVNEFQRGVIKEAAWIDVLNTYGLVNPEEKLAGFGSWARGKMQGPAAALALLGGGGGVGHALHSEQQAAARMEQALQARVSSGLSADHAYTRALDDGAHFYGKGGIDSPYKTPQGMNLTTDGLPRGVHPNFPQPTYRPEVSVPRNLVPERDVAALRDGAGPGALHPQLGQFANGPQTPGYRYHGNNNWTRQY